MNINNNNNWETERIGHLAVVRGSEVELKSFRDALKTYINADIYDSLNIEFIENETKNLIEKNRALSYLRVCLDIPPLKIDNPSEYPELLSELVDKEYALPPIQEFNKLEIPVSCVMAGFLVEIFCPDQQQKEKYQLETKRFYKEKTIYKLLIYASLPVSIETVFMDGYPHHCVIKFADTEIASAQQIHDQVKFALRIFLLKTCIGRYMNVDIGPLNSNYLQKMSEDLECSILKVNYLQANTEDLVYGNKGSFCLYVLPNQFGEEPRNRILYSLQNLFQSIQLFQCERCQKFVSHLNNSDCVIPDLDKNQDEDMVFSNHSLTTTTPSYFDSGAVQNV